MVDLISFIYIYSSVFRVMVKQLKEKKIIKI